MPYDPTPVGDRDALSVHVEGKKGDPDRVYILGRPSNGVVEVREIVGGCAPVERAEDADALLARFERLSRERRRLSAELYAIREWLAGR